jgi:hypothetical protein
LILGAEAKHQIRRLPKVRAGPGNLNSAISGVSA